LKGLKGELAESGPDMMPQIAIAITVAWAYSAAVIFGLEGKVFYGELVTLIDIMLLGHWLEMRSINGIPQPARLRILLPVPGRGVNAPPRAPVDLINFADHHRQRCCSTGTKCRVSVGVSAFGHFIQISLNNRG
jgi:hypothetical protein